MKILKKLLMVMVVCFPAFAATAQSDGSDRLWYQMETTSDEKLASGLAQYLNSEGKLLGEKIGVFAYAAAKKAGYPGSNLEAKDYVVKWFDIYGTQLNLNPQQFYTLPEIRSFALADSANPGFPLLTEADLGQVASGTSPAATTPTTGATPAVKVTEPGVTSEEVTAVVAAQVAALRNEIKAELARGDKTQATRLSQLKQQLSTVGKRMDAFPSADSIKATQREAKNAAELAGQAGAAAIAATSPEALGKKVAKALEEPLADLRQKTSDEVNATVTTIVAAETSSLWKWLSAVAAAVGGIFLLSGGIGYLGHRRLKKVEVKTAALEEEMLVLNRVVFPKGWMDRVKALKESTSTLEDISWNGEVVPVRITYDGQKYQPNVLRSNKGSAQVPPCDAEGLEAIIARGVKTGRVSTLPIAGPSKATRQAPSLSVVSGAASLT